MLSREQDKHGKIKTRNSVNAAIMVSDLEKENMDAPWGARRRIKDLFGMALVVVLLFNPLFFRTILRSWRLEEPVSVDSVWSAN